jgi:hypothetical protein
MRRISRNLILTIFVSFSMGCQNSGNGPAKKDDVVRKQTAGTTSTAPDVRIPAPREPSFLELIPELRKEVRSRSLQTWVELPDDLPFYRLKVGLDTDFMSYDGELDLWVKNHSPDTWNELSFHLYPNSPGLAGSLKYIKITAARVGSQEVTGRDLPSRYELPLPTPLPPGESTTVHLSFRGLVKRHKIHDKEDPFSDIWGTLFALMSEESGDYGIFSYSSGTISLSVWYPILAAYDHGGWDIAPPDDIGDFSYFDVADYLLELSLPDDFLILSSGEVEKVNKDQVVVRAGGVRELTVVAGRDLEQQERTTGRQGSIRVRSVARPGFEQTRELILDAAVDSIIAFEELFGPYPYTELEIVQTDLFGGAGGVEFPGLITIASFLYLDTWIREVPEEADMLSSRFLKESIQFVVAHEVAHQWWNAVVGSHSRNHPFVDEAMANMSAILFFEHRYGRATADRQSFIELTLPYQLYRFLGGKDLPVDLPTREFKDLLSYSAIVYSKGALFLDRLRHIVGRDSFQKALATYYRDFQFKIAGPKDLTAAIAKNSGKEEEVRKETHRWLREAYGDQDIALFDPARVVPMVLEELDVKLDGFVLSQLAEPGFWEVVKLAANLASGESNMFNGVREKILMEWATEMAKKLVWDLLM